MTAFEEADAAYRAEIDRSAEAGEISAAVPKLKSKAEALLASLRSDVHSEQFAAAERQVENAEQKLRSHFNAYRRQLYLEIIAPAVKVEEEIRAARAELAERIKSWTVQQDVARGAVWTLFQDIRPDLDELLPSNHDDAPRLPEDFLARHCPTAEEEQVQTEQQAEREAQDAARRSVIVGGGESA